jgi:hypothetical protein
MRLIGCPETSLEKNRYTMREIPEERRPHLHRGGSLKSRFLHFAAKNPSCGVHWPTLHCAQSK